MNAEAPYAGQRLDVVDGLRGIAIAMVVWYHLWLVTWLTPPYFNIFGKDIALGFIPTTGFLGVELFFFISGFCLFFPYARSMHEGKPLQTLPTYVYRRAIKILPSYWLVLVILGFATMPWTTWFGAFWQIMTHVFFIHNWYHDASGTFAGVLWSLGVEVQFYVIFPLCVAAFIRRPWVTFAAMATLALGYRLVIQHGFRSDYHFLLNEMPAFLDLFAAGMLAAYLFVLGRSKLGWARYAGRATALALLGCALALVMVYHLFESRYAPDGILDWQADFRIFFALSLTLVTVGSLFAARWWRMVIANPILLFLSTISYNLYMWHQVVMLWLHDRHIPPFATPDAHNDVPWKWLFTALALPLVIGVASLITYAFERPFLRRGPRLLVEVPRAVGRRLGVSFGDRGEAEALH